MEENGDVRKISFVVVLAAVSLYALGGCRGTGPDIRVDGRFDDWSGVSPAYIDPGDEGARRGIDLRGVWIADNGDDLFVRFSLGKDISLQSGNGLVLYLDTDNSPGTGMPVGGIGADFSWRFGRNKGFVYSGDDSVAFNAYDADLVTAPTVTSSEFELRIPKDAVIGDQSPLLPLPEIGWVLRDEGGWGGDAAPAEGGRASYTFEGKSPPRFPPRPIGKESPAHVRVVTHNVYEDGIFKQQDVFARILKALRPDILCLQEVRRHRGGELKELVERITGGRWFVAGRFDCFTLSRYPIAGVVPARGATGTLIDLPDEDYATDIFVVNAHLGSGTKEARRQREADSIVALIRDMKGLGEEEGLTPGTPIVLVGDLNLVGLARQRRTLLTGDIANEKAFGADSPPDWDGTPMTDLLPFHIAAPDSYTWTHYKRKAFSPGRLDYIIYTDSAASVANCFVLRTETMPGAGLEASGLRRKDSSTASDHLPVVADFVIGKPPDH